MAEVYLLLGSNLGDRHQYLQHAVKALAHGLGGIKSISSVYETEPWGVSGQAGYLNQVLCIETSCNPDETLTATQHIERQNGRIIKGDWQSRTLDIDILFYDGLIISLPHLRIPHPLLHDRRFTLVPLVEIAPYFMHPVLGKTLLELLDECPDTSSVTNVGR